MDSQNLKIWKWLDYVHLNPQSNLESRDELTLVVPCISNIPIQTSSPAVTVARHYHPLLQNISNVLLVHLDNAKGSHILTVNSYQCGLGEASLDAATETSARTLEMQYAPLFSILMETCEGQ